MNPPFDEVRSWMFEAALPLWGGAGVDRARGGFYEELDLAGRPTDVAFKRTRVTCRQIYVFSHAALLGWKDGLELSAWGYDYLVKSAWMGPDKGWAKRVSADGGVLDPAPDLYDYAFVLFALAWRHRASGDREPIARAHVLLDLLERDFRAGAGLGFRHEHAPGGWRWQNPHMHLLEASIAMYEACGEQRFLAMAQEVVTLFRTRFFDGRTLAEYFDETLKRAPGEAGRLTEPGHQLEWAWILAQYQRLTREDVSHEARALVEFAEAHGVDPVSHATFNEVRDDGAPLNRASRTWPNTERLKGHLALFELGGHDPMPVIAETTRLLLDRHLAVEPRGSWIDLFDEAGKPLSKTAPTSTLYHVFLAFAELLRLESKLAG